MTNNDILRTLRYVFNYNDDQMMAIFTHVEEKVPRSLICAWLKKDDEEGFQELLDVELSKFLNGLIIERRGRKEGPLPEPELELDNNIILRKLKIAMDFKDDDMIKTLELADFRLSKYELSAFFRRTDNKNYRKCKNQILRNFLKGLKVHFAEIRTGQ